MVDERPSSATTSVDGRHLSCSLSAVALRLVRAEHGDDGVEALLADPGVNHTADFLEDPEHWISLDEAMALLGAGVRLTGDPRFARRVGESTVAYAQVSPVATLLRSLGSPEAVLESVALAAAKQSTISDLECLEAGAGRAVVRAVARDGFARHPLYCDWATGLLATTTTLFGLPPARVRERECQARGGSQCLYEVSWDPALAAASVDPERRAALFEARFAQLSERLERAYATASDLVSPDDVDTVLRRIVRRAASAVRAPTYVLAVRTDAGAQPTIYAEGVDDSDAGAIAQRVLARGDDDPSALAVEVASSRHHYGHLIACYPNGMHFYPQERRLLDHYAKHAAAVLDMATALEQSARRHARAEALSRRLEKQTRLLNASLKRYEKLVAAFPGIVCVIEVLDDGELKPVYISSQLETITGMTAQQWESDPHSMVGVVHPDDRERWRRTIPNLRPEAPQPEFRLLGRDGRVVWVRAQAGFFTEHGRRYVQGILLDVTAAKQAEADRARMELELRLAQKLEAVGQLAAGVAHEINTPVQFVGDTVRFLSDVFDDLMKLVESYAELGAAVETGADPSEALRRARAAERFADLDYLRDRVPAAFGRAFDGTERVARIVRAMREFAHPPTSDHVPVDINDALRNTLVVATNEYKYVADVELDLGDLPPVPGNAGDLNQAFLNVLVNAAQAIAEVVGSSGERGTITIRAVSEGDEVVVTISDTGPGIPPAVASRVFDPFFTTKEPGRGTGQGLAIARTIVVERHGGKLSFAPNEAGGTTFEIRLPAADRAAATAEAAPLADPA